MGVGKLFPSKFFSQRIGTLVARASMQDEKGAKVCVRIHMNSNDVFLRTRGLLND